LLLARRVEVKAAPLARVPGPLSVFGPETLSSACGGNQPGHVADPRLGSRASGRAVCDPAVVVHEVDGRV